jgi:hypothetical protein
VVVWAAKRARMSSGPVNTTDLAWLIVAIRPLRAERLATVSTLIASTVPLRPPDAEAAWPDRAARAAATASRVSDLPVRRRS